MLLREVQARPIQGDHLRALRRRGDAAEGPPRAHGSHRPRRPGLAHLVLQGRSEPHRLPPRHRPARAREGPVLRRVDRHGRRPGEARRRPRRPRGQGSRGVRADLRRPRRAALRARRPLEATSRLSLRRQGQGLRRGRRVLGPRALELGRGPGDALTRGRADAGRRDLPRPREDGRGRGSQAASRACPPDRDPRRPAARAARDRVRGHGRAGDPRGARSAPRRARQGLGREEGRHHEAPPQGARPAALGRGARGRRRRARRVDRREEPRARTRDRERPPPRRPRARRRRRRPRAGARARVRPLPRRGRPQGGPRGRPALGDQGQGDGRRHREPPRGHARGGGRGRPSARGHLEALPRARRQAGRQRRAAVPRAQGPVRLAVRVRRVLPRRDGRGGDPGAAPGSRPPAGVHQPARHDQDVQGAEAAARDQEAEGRPGVHHLGEQARVDGARGRAGDPAGAPADGPARRWPLRHERPERPLPARHQQEQPPQAAPRPRRARDHRQQREAHAPGGRRRAVRQRPPRACGDRTGQPAAQVALGHAEGQAGPVPPEPARQAGRLLGTLGDRRRAESQAPSVWPAEADGARALQAVHHEPAGRAQVGPEHQGREEARRVDGPRGLGRPRGGHRGASGAAQPGADAAPPRDPGVRAGARRGQGDPGPSARVSRVQRGLRRRPDGGRTCRSPRRRRRRPAS